MNPILEMRGITKLFPGVRALDGVNLTVREGEIHAVVGENGAGKSTLMKVLSGVYPHGSYEGDILFRGEPARFGGVADSEALGIVIIHQELALVPTLSIAENVYLGNEQARRGVIDWHATRAGARALLATVGLDAAPETPVGELGIGQQQLVEIAKALSKRVRLLILDEPTASLNERDSDALLALLIGFKAQGIASILISHKLGEVSRVADAITILRDGASVETLDVRGSDEGAGSGRVSGGRPGRIDEDRIIRGMVGRDMAHRYPPRTPRIGEVILDVRDWVVHHPVHPERQVVKGVSFHARRGEIVGIAGLMGAGRTELAMSLFGHAYGQRISGEVILRGERVRMASVGDAIAQGLAYVTEDRKGLGLILQDSIRTNVTLANLQGVADRGIIAREREHRVAEDYRASLRVRASNVAQGAATLSGGNQQKVLLGKWLFTGPDVLILDEPTRGVDVGAKYEIYALVNEVADAGKAVVMISSEMPELLGMCDRIYVMSEGRFVGEFTAAEATQERIMRSMVAGEGQPA